MLTQPTIHPKQRKTTWIEKRFHTWFHCGDRCVTARCVVTWCRNSPLWRWSLQVQTRKPPAAWRGPSASGWSVTRNQYLQEVTAETHTRAHTHTQTPQQSLWAHRVGVQFNLTKEEDSGTTRYHFCSISLQRTSTLYARETITVHQICDSAPDCANAPRVKSFSEYLHESLEMQSSQNALLLAWRRLKKTKRARSQRETHTTNLSVWNCWRAPPPARRIGRLRVWNSLPPHPNKSGHRGYAAATVTSQEAAAGWQRRCQTLDLERRDQVTSRLFVGFVFFFFGLCLSLSPGTAVTSLSKVKSSSSVGGWCCRGQFDTAAVSCSSNKIHTWIRPAGHESTKMHWRERKEEES